MRLDIYLAEQKLAKSRSRAATLIDGGFVTVNGIVVTKASYDVKEDDAVLVTGEEHGFVGRGGMKLDGALTRFSVDVTGLICADIGASTGGFTDCLLKRGAVKVYAADSGHGQLDESLVSDARVVNLEGVNARYLNRELIPEACGLAVCDLSFISQTLVIPAVREILGENGRYLALIKPQFECGRDAVGKGGIVKDKKQHTAAIRKVLASASENGLIPKKIMKSPIQGGDGNTEFLFLAEVGGLNTVTEQDIREAVNE